MKRLALVALLACTACSPTGSNTQSERQLIVAKRQEMLERHKASGMQLEKLQCPAKTISDETAEALLLVYVNDRPDLIEKSRMRAVTDDVVAAFMTCGATSAQVAYNFKTEGETLFQGLALEVLAAGRGLS